MVSQEAILFNLLLVIIEGNLDAYTIGWDKRWSAGLGVLADDISDSMIWLGISCFFCSCPSRGLLCGRLVKQGVSYLSLWFEHVGLWHGLLGVFSSLEGLLFLFARRY